MWQNMEDGVVWAKNWTQHNAKIVARRAQRRSLLGLGGLWWQQQQAAELEAEPRFLWSLRS
jgi:hypothetical protein